MTLDEEKLKLEHSHRLEVRRIWLEKGLLTVIIAIAGFATNIWFENYKNALERSRFLLEARQEALGRLRVIYSALGQHAFAEMSSGSEAEHEAYEKDVVAFFHVINKSGFLFPSDIELQFTNQAWLHQEMARADFQIRKEHWGFLLDAADDFDNVTREAAFAEVGSPPAKAPPGSFRLLVWEPKQALAKGTARLFEENFAKWRNEHGKK